MALVGYGATRSLSPRSIGFTGAPVGGCTSTASSGGGEGGETRGDVTRGVV